jgi:2-oxoisovalerate dehydrogenase E2 component (dihydrolipoyl transacylase)
MGATSSSCPMSAKAPPRPRSSPGMSRSATGSTKTRPLVDVMTDKATVEMTSPVSAGSCRSRRARRDGAGRRAAGRTRSGRRGAGDKPLASPAVRQRAEELGIQLQFVPGSGPGRPHHATPISTPMSRPAARRSARASGYAQARRRRRVKVIGLRRKIAEKMQESKRRIPHFAYVEEIDMTELESLRAHLNATKRADQPKLTCCRS